MSQPYNGIPADELMSVVWRKSSFSNPSGNCVEIARLPSGIAMRNSRDPHGPALVYTLAEVSAFIEGSKNGDFDGLVSVS